jgi:biopolymer transport protein ExbB
MKAYIFIPIVLTSWIISYMIWLKLLPEFVREGGPLITVIMTLSMVAVTFMIERTFTLRRAKGKADLAVFARKLRAALDANDIAQAVDVCRAQGGSLANVVGAGLERYLFSANSGLTPAARIASAKKAIQEANALETPLLERNLNAIATIASIATLMGLLGTVIGMIRSFQAMGHAGAPDAAKLAVGISEALINTAGGLALAIIAILAYNYFTVKVDGFNYMIDETSHEIVQQLEERTGVMYGQA